MSVNERKTKSASLSVIAKATGYSTATVSHALNDSGRVSPETRERIRQVAEGLGYETPRRRRAAQARTIAVVLSANVHEDQTPNYYVGDLLAGVEAAARARGIEVMIGFWDEQRPTILANTSLGGVLYLGGDFDPTELRQVPIPGVIVGSYLPGLRIPAVLADNRQGAYLATRALLDAGCRRIALANGQLTAPTSGDKYLGYCDALHEAGQQVDHSRVVHVDFSIAGGMAAGRQLLAGSAGIDGIVAGDDPIAVGIIQVAWRQGIDIPGDLSIIGYGDGVMSRESDPALSTVQVHRREMAKAAVDLLTTREGQRPRFSHRVLLPPSLELRGTTKSR